MSFVDTVVAAVDFSGDGLDGARWAATHLDPGRVILVHALHVPEPPGFLRGLWGDREQIEVSARSGASARLDEFAAQLARETGVDVDARVRMGRPAEQIRELAESVDADLLVVGPHEHGEAHWTYLGSTAERLLHDARRPTMLATGELRPPRRILAAIDDSAVAAGILRALRGLKEATGAAITVLHVVDDSLDMTYRAILAPRAPDRRTELEAEAERWLGERLEDAGCGDDYEPLVVLGEPPIEILASARRLAADLIVMGTRGAGTAARFLIGGVAGMVIRGARCPVWLLPTPHA